jgi:hypothetical protein
MTKIFQGTHTDGTGAGGSGSVETDRRPQPTITVFLKGGNQETWAVVVSTKSLWHMS